MINSLDYTFDDKAKIADGKRCINANTFRHIELLSNSAAVLVDSKPQLISFQLIICFYRRNGVKMTFFFIFSDM